MSLTIQANDAGSSPIEAYTTTCSVLEADEEMSPPLHLLNVNTGNFEISATAPAPVVEVSNLSDTIATQNIFQSNLGALSIVLDEAKSQPVILNVARYFPFATNSKLYLDNAELDPNLLTKRQYFRGMVSGRPNSFAFLSLQPNGEFDIHYRTAGTVTSGHFDAGGLTTNSALEQLLLTVAQNRLMRYSPHLS